MIKIIHIRPLISALAFSVILTACAVGESAPAPAPATTAPAETVTAAPSPETSAATPETTAPAPATTAPAETATAAPSPETSAPAPAPGTSAQATTAPARVSYLGPEGTYTQEACWQFFGREGDYLPYPSVNDAVDALERGETDFAVIPQENTIGGAVIDYVDTLIARESVAVCGEVELPINQNLLALPEAELSDIRTVYSHKQGIAQGREWLENHLPDAEVIEVSSTAEGAKMVSEGNDKSCAAIASAGCAEVYGLNLLAEKIQNNDKNKTRFYVLTKEEPQAGEGERLAFIASGRAEDMPELMAEMSNGKMTLVALHDRPLKTELGQYNYLIECADTDYKSYEQLTKNENFEFRYLGSFEVK